MQKVSLQLSKQDPALARKISSFLKTAKDQLIPKPLIGDTMSDFIAEYKVLLPGSLVDFADTTMKGDPQALAAADNLLGLARIYFENADELNFAECLRQLNTVTPISPTPWDKDDESALLLHDAAQVGALAVMMAAEWIAWGLAFKNGDERAALQAAYFGPFLKAGIGIVIFYVIYARFAQRNPQGLPAQAQS